MPRAEWETRDREADLIDALGAKIPNVLAITETGCWIFAGYVNRQGYGQTANAEGRTVYAHRLAYEEARGPIPDGLTIDHLCSVRCCINPEHLEAVTIGENARRGQIRRRAREAATV